MIDGYTYLLTVDVFDLISNIERTLYFSSGLGFTSLPSDTPSNQTYDARLSQPIDVDRSVFALGSTGGQGKVGIGDIVIENADGDLDVMLSYAFGRPVTVSVGEASAQSLTDFERLFLGVAEQAEFQNNTVILKVRDIESRLLLPLQDRRYGGTNVLPNGLDGLIADLAGKQRPLILGAAFNVSMVHVNTSKLIYEANSVACASVPVVRDRGVPLTSGGVYASLTDLQNDALAPAAGQYKVYLGSDTEGTYVRLGSSAAGVVTADITEANRNAANTFNRVMTYCGLPQVTAPAIALGLKTANQAIAIVVREDESAASVLDRALSSVGAWWTINSVGAYDMDRLERPVAPVVATFTENEIIGPPSRQATSDKSRGAPVYRVVLNYGRNHTPLDNDALAFGVGEEERTRLNTAWRTVIKDDATVKTRNPLAVEMIIDTDIVNVFGADQEASRLLALHSVQRHRFDITVLLDDKSRALDLGDVIGLSHPRYGLRLVGDTQGTPFRILGVSPNARSGRVRLTLWGSSLLARNIKANTGELLGTDSGDVFKTGAQ